MYKLKNKQVFKFCSKEAKKLNVRSPYDGEIVFELQKHNYQEAEKKIEKNAQKQKIFQQSSLQQRIDLVQQAKQYFIKEQDKIAIQVTKSMGKPIYEARNEVKTLITRMDALCEMSLNALQDDIIRDNDDNIQKIVKEPLGNIMCIAPWNYPLITLINVVTTGILCGNSILIKHSPYTGNIGKIFEKAFEVEKGLVSDLVIDIPIVQKLLHHPLIDMVSFTGSVQTGLDVFENVQEYHYTHNNKFTEVGLELGGKDGFYVRKDVENLKKVAESLVEGACYNAGQSCCSVERIYVHDEIYDQFIEECEIALKQYRLGDPMSENTNLGPMTLPSAPQNLQLQVEEAVLSGARLISGGLKCTDDSGKGNFFEPTLLADCDNGMTVFLEESFGPIVAIGRVKDDNEAVNLINDSKYGLTAGIYTSDLPFAKQFCSQLNVGTVFMNRNDFLDPYLPWAGRKLSGRGVGLSKYSFNNLTKLKGYNFNIKKQ